MCKPLCPDLSLLPRLRRDFGILPGGEERREEGRGTEGGREGGGGCSPLKGKDCSNWKADQNELQISSMEKKLEAQQTVSMDLIFK